jgi:hypothetical protein
VKDRKKLIFTCDRYVKINNMKKYKFARKKERKKKRQTAHAQSIGLPLSSHVCLTSEI